MHPSLLIFFFFLSSCLSIQKLSYEEQFLRFKQKYKKEYKDVKKEQEHFEVFKRNVLEVERHNRDKSNTYTKGINQWSDMTQAEWEDIYLGGYKKLGAGQTKEIPKALPTVIRRENLPGHVDWRDEGAVTDVKDQGRCGSCWAFGMTEQVESYTAIETGQLVELSAQQVTSCTPNPLTCGGSGGCQGSTPPLGYNYIQLFGQVSETDYPYISGETASTESCEYDLAKIQPIATITGYNNLPPNDQDAVMNHIANVGPLAISVAASNFKDYQSGVFTGCDYDQNIQLNHAVQLVGYGSDYSPAGVVPYWLVRNSWGKNWGDEGYIRLLRESTPQCGMDTATSGHVCEGGPGYSDPLHVCGMCGMLFETSYPLGAHLL